MPISVGHRHWSSARGSEAQGFQQKHSGHRRRSDFGMAAGRALMAAAPILFILMGATEAVGNTELNQLLAEVEEFAKTGPGGENNAVEVITFTSDSWTALSEFLSKLAEVADANNYLEYLQKASSVILQCIDKIEASIKEKIPSLEYTEAIHAAVQDLHVTQTDPSTIAEAASALSGWIQAAKKAIKSFPADDEWAKAMGCILLFKKVYQKSLDFTGSLSQVQKNPEAVAGRRMQGEPPPIEIQVPLTGGISTVNGDTRPPNGFDWSRLGFCGASITGPGILYSLEAPGTGSITLSTCGAADFDTKISVYQGVDPDTASCVTGDDEATPEAGCSGFTTDVSFDVVQGQSFLALVHGFGTSTGTFTLTVTSNVVSTPPPAIEIQVPSTVAGDTAANGYPWFSLGGCGPSFTGLGILYSLEAPGTGGITVSTCNNADFDTKISVYQGADPATASCVTGEDDTVGCSGFTTEVSFDAEKGQSFLVLVHGFGASTGTFSLSTTPDLIPIQVPSTVAGDTAANGFPWSSLGFCGTSITAPGILYSLEAPGTGGITVSTCNSASYNTKISVYQGADPATASCVTGLDDTPGCSGLTTKLSFYAVDGQGFLVLVHGSATGTFSLSTAFEATPDPVPIAVSTCGAASYNTKISVYQGADPATASCVTGLDDTPGCSGLTTKLSFYAEKGQSFLVLVHGGGSETGTFTLRVRFVVWCQEVGGLEYSLLDKGKKNVVSSCLKRSVLREFSINEAAVNQRLGPMPSGGSLVLVLGLVALFGFTALAALLVKRSNAGNASTMMADHEPRLRTQQQEVDPFMVRRSGVHTVEDSL
eukprot:symbB.v1.2.037515.t1/scaffold5561.1/size25837/2